MTFQANIPQPGTFISISQNDLLNNFIQLDASWNTNHVGFNAGAGTGKHFKVEMPNQIADPAGAANEMTIFSRYTVLPATGVVDLWYKRNNEATAYQLTGPNPYFNNSPLEASTFLPGGFVFKSGKRTRAEGSTPLTWNGSTFSFINAFPNNIYSIIISMQRGTTTPHSYYVSNNTVPTTSGFTLVTDDNSWDFLYYSAIGN